MAEALLERLRALDVCAVSDALDRLKLPASVGGIAPQTLRARIAGRVATVKFAAGSRTGARHACTAAVEAAEPGGIVVVEQRTGVDAAGWGGILSRASRTRSLSGAIVDGPARDIDEALEVGFPVYARACTARTARGRIYEADTQCPVVIGEVTVHPGDYALADSSGVAFIPAAEIERVLDAAEAIAAREAAMTGDVEAGQPVSQVMGQGYEHMLKGN
ncbi:MAG TPA: RraA family protein [Caulobacteraceae bacterium]|jgi:regulator of RNase E activity RraA